MDKPIATVPQSGQLSLRGLRPEKRLGEMLPAILLVRTSWLIRLVAKVTFVLLAIALVAMFMLPWQQTARGNGTVYAFDPQQRPQTVNSPQDGVIKEVRPDLREGTFVHKGELIVEIEPFAPEAMGQVQSQIQQLEGKKQNAIQLIALAEQTIELQRISGDNLLLSIEKEVEATRQKLGQVERELKVIEADLAQKEYDKRLVEALFPKGLESQQELIAKRTSYDQAVEKVAKAKAMVAEFLSTLIGKEREQESKAHDIYIKNRQAEQKVEEERSKLATIEKELTDLNIKMGELGRLKVTSPVDGVLHQIYSIQGANSVKKGDSLFVVVPQINELAVELTVAGRDMPLVHVDDKVRLQFQGWPAVQFVGWPSAAVGTFGGKVAALSPTDDAKGNFSLLVIPDPEEPAWPDNRYLRQGVRASGWVLLRQVSLGYEIWRQLNGFPPVISDQEPTKSSPDKGGFDSGKSSKVKLPKS